MPLAIEAVRRIDEIFAVEREINGAAPEHRHVVRQERIKPLVTALESWMRTERARLSRHAETAKAIDYMLKRWPAFTRFLDDGRICLSNNAAERALRGIAIGRRAWLFAGSDRGGERAAAMFTLIETAKLNDVDPLLMRVGRVDRMPLAVDDNDDDLALALGERIAGAEISAQRPHHLRQLRAVHPNLVRPAEGTAGLDQRAITLLLLRRHLVIGNFGIAAKGWRIGHFGFPP
jgi:hypothetical protein